MRYTQYMSQPNERRYREILEHAARLIFQHGYEATSMQEIAESCGLTKAGLYPAYFWKRAANSPISGL